MKPFEVYSLFDIEICRASGATLWDREGRSYLDLYGGHAVISVGHSHPRYVQALTEQLKKIGFYSNSIHIAEQKILAEKLGRLSGYPDYSLFMCNSGAEANENAFKLASFQNGRKQIIAFKGAFHGRTSLAVAATDNPSISAAVNQCHEVVFLPFNDTEALENQISEQTCAVIIEGIQGVGGVNTPSAEFLQKAAALCKKHGAVLILDEVQSGYGRSGRFFAHQHAGIQPDLITIAKGMGNGFPVAGVLISPAFEARKESLGTTFGGNYLACAAANSVLDIIEEEDLIRRAEENGRYLHSVLQGIEGIRRIKGTGLMCGIELSIPCADIRRELLYRFGIFTGSASEKNTIRILPALNIRKEDLDRFAAALRTLLSEIQ